MRVIKIQRTIGKDKKVIRSTARRSLGQFARVFSPARIRSSSPLKPLCSPPSWRFRLGRFWRPPARLADCCRRQRAKVDRGRPKDGRKKSFASRRTFCKIFNQMVKYYSATLNRTFAALADPTRRRLLAHLARGDQRVTHLARPHAMSLPAVSKHLRVLQKPGLLRRRRYGRVHEMQLDAKPLKEAAKWVEEYRKFWEG